MQDFHTCPYCSEDLEQWSVRFRRSDLVAAGEWRETGASPEPASGAAEGLTLLSLCPSDRCGYYVLRYRNGLVHWDRDVEAARLVRTVFGASD
jgi:hypothetical protein